MKTKNLTFMEAVEQMKLGKKVRRSCYEKSRYNWIDCVEIRDNKYPTYLETK